MENDKSERNDKTYMYKTKCDDNNDKILGTAQQTKFKL